MEELAEEVKDRSLLRLLAFYKRFPKPVIARLVAGALHQNRHTAVIDLLTEKLKRKRPFIRTVPLVKKQINS